MRSRAAAPRSINCASMVMRTRAPGSSEPVSMSRSDDLVVEILHPVLTGDSKTGNPRDGFGARLCGAFSAKTRKHRDQCLPPNRAFLMSKSAG